MLILVVISNMIMIMIIFINPRTLSSDCNINSLLLAAFIIKIFIITIKMSIISKIRIIMIVIITIVIILKITKIIIERIKV